MAVLRLDEGQRFDWLRLWRSAGVGPRTFIGLINRFGGAGAAIEALPALARTHGRQVQLAEIREIEREMATADRCGARFVALGEPEYPALLAKIDAPPPLLAVLGRIEIAARPAVALVGSRNASVLGLTMAERLAGGLAAAGFTTVSGLARGIDTRVHRASLAGGTIAVLAGGLDRPYPPENAALLHEIIAGGLAVSEMPFGHEPRAKDFPRRNRLIAGLAHGTVVVEAARASGSLITARLANEQGRLVFAVPGSPLDPRAEGANDLLAEGATLTRRVEDIVEAIVPMIEGTGIPAGVRESVTEEKLSAALFDEWLETDENADGAPAGIDSAAVYDADVTSEPGAEADPAMRLMAVLSAVPADLDSVLRAADISVREGLPLLAELELAGRIARHSGNRVSRHP